MKPSTTPWYTSKTLWASVAAFLAGVPAILDQAQLLDLGLTPQQRGVMILVSAACGLAAPILARMAGEAAVKNLEEGKPDA